MTATADLNGNNLEVTLEAAQVPNRQAMTTFVQKGLNNLGVDSISSVKIFGKQTGAASPTWVQEIDMESPPTTNGEVVSSPLPVTPGIATPLDPVDPASSSLNHAQASTLGTSTSTAVPIPGPGSIVDTSISPATEDALFGDHEESTVIQDNSHNDSLFEDEASTIIQAKPLNQVDLSPTHTELATAPNQPASDDSLIETLPPGESPLPATPIDLDDPSLRGTYALNYPDHPLNEATNPDLPDDTPSQGPPVGVTLPPADVGHEDDWNDLNPVEQIHDLDQEQPSPTPLYPAPDPSPDSPGLAVEQNRVPDPTLSSAVAYPTDDVYHPPVRPSQPVEPPGEAPPESEPEESAPIPWGFLVLALVVAWIIGLIASSLWAKLASKSPSPEPTTASSTPLAASPQPSSPATATSPTPAANSTPRPPIVALPASPGVAASPSPKPSASPKAQASPTPRPANNSAAAALVDVSLPPPAIACQTTPATGAPPLTLSNLKFEQVATADGDYIIGCITNRTNQPINQVSISFQGDSTQNTEVRQTGSSPIILTTQTIQPQQTIPFRSRYTINPAVNNLQIQTISWAAPGANQPQQRSINQVLKR
jgi:hypothetical protein